MPPGLKAAVFIADAIDNGAGYAVELARPERFSRLIDHARTGLLQRLTDPEHAVSCLTSCPDCLRAWDNQRLHGVLNWRLGLDLFDLAAGSELDLSRWLDDRGVDRIRTTVDDMTLEQSVVRPMADGSVVLELSDLVLWFGHPLWERSPDGRFPQTAPPSPDLVRGRAVRCTDPVEFDKRPVQVLGE